MLGPLQYLKNVQLSYVMCSGGELLFLASSDIIVSMMSCDPTFNLSITSNLNGIIVRLLLLSDTVLLTKTRTSTLNLLNKIGLLKILDDGRRVIDLDDNNRRVAITKSDGSSLYVTRDIAAALDRYITSYTI